VDDCSPTLLLELGCSRSVGSSLCEQRLVTARLPLVYGLLDFVSVLLSPLL